MAVELTVPEVGESITEVLIVEWLKKPGDSIETDEPVAVIETDKATLEIPAPQGGTLGKILKKKDEWAKVGEAIATIEEGEAGAKKKARGGKPKEAEPAEAEEESEEKVPAGKKAAAKKTQKKESGRKAKEESENEASGDGRRPARRAPAARDSERHILPAAARLIEEHGLDADEIEGTGPGGRVLKEDVQRHLDQSDGREEPEEEDEEEGEAVEGAQEGVEPGRETETVPMSPLRRTVARRLVEAQQNAALLTTFNEIDMTQVKALRKEHGEAFEKRYGVRLGFVSFFIKASIEALKAIPELNAEIRDRDIVYHNYYDIGIAVGGGKGLVVPVLRNAERKSFAEIEREISDLASRARANKLELAELEGGTFTISNGGIYGSLLSTPIINPPQSGILGLHAIQDRAVVVNKEIVIRPMMYVALTYDHRLVDGREAVTFLKRVKEVMETPSRMLLEI